MSDTFDYTKSLATADRLITKFGAPASLRRVTNTGTDFDPVQTTTDYATLAVKVDFTMKQMQGGNVLDTDERWLVAAGPLSVSILPADALVVGGLVRPVLIAKPLAPAGVTVMYDCQIRF